MITQRVLWWLPALFLMGMLASRDIVAQETLRTWTNIQSTSMVWIEDLDGDGCRDLVIGNAFHSLRRQSNVGRVFVVSGADGNVIREHIGPSMNFVLGVRVFNVGDIDGDGKQDYGSRGGSPSEAFIYSGADGKELLHRGGEGVFLGTVLAMLSIGDSDGDARGEFVFGVTIAAEIYKGGVSKPKLVIPVSPEATRLRFGLGSTTLGDLDGDKISEFAFSAPTAGDVHPTGPGHVFVFSGGKGKLLHDLWRPDEYAYARFGEGLASPGDLNGDAMDDLAVGSPDGSPPGGFGAAGIVRFYDGLTGESFDQVGPPPGGGGDWGKSITLAGDVNGNGFDDLFVNCLFNGGQSIVAIDGRTKEVLHRFGGVQQPMGGADWNGDDFPDHVQQVGMTTWALKSGAPEGVQVVGTAYTPQRGLLPRIGVTGSARLGTTMKFHLSRVPPGQDALLVIGVPRIRTGHMFGDRGNGPRTTIHPVNATTVRPGEGVATVELRVPLDAVLTGSHITARWLVQSRSGQLLARTRTLDCEILPAF